MFVGSTVVLVLALVEVVPAPSWPVDLEWGDISVAADSYLGWKMLVGGVGERERK